MSPMPTTRCQSAATMNLPSLAESVNDWCGERAIHPASGQAAESLSERNIRYYRTLGLLDGPLAGGGYGRRHFLQLSSIRVLQARGLPLKKIQELLYGRLVLARVEEKSEAERLYKKAKAEGRRAAMASGERENLFTLELGNLQPEDVILMRFSYIQPLQRLQEQRTLRVPMTPGVRFIPGNPLLRANSGTGASDDTDEVPDASRISPPRIDGSHPDAAALQISVRLRGGVETARGVSSPSHILAVRPKENDLCISLAADREFPDKDFVMTWAEPAPDAPVARLWLDESRRGVLELRLPNTQHAASAPACDVYFLLDRSGSMKGANWTGACRAVAGLKSGLDPETPVWLTLFESCHRDWAEKPLAAKNMDFGPDCEALERIGTAGGKRIRLTQWWGM